MKKKKSRAASKRPDHYAPLLRPALTALPDVPAMVKGVALAAAISASACGGAQHEPPMAPPNPTRLEAPQPPPDPNEPPMVAPQPPPPQPPMPPDDDRLRRQIPPQTPPQRGMIPPQPAPKRGRK